MRDVKGIHILNETSLFIFNKCQRFFIPWCQKYENENVVLSNATNSSSEEVFFAQKKGKSC